MDAALEAELRLNPTAATLVQIDFPSGSAYWTDGGFVSYDSGAGAQTFVTVNPTYGTISAIGNVVDGVGGQTTRVPITFQPIDDAAVTALKAPALQGTRVRIWEGAINRATGALIGAPELKFDGEIDRPKVSVGTEWAVTLECGTQAERQLEPNVDWRLNHPFHSLVWPGEVGLSHVTNVLRKIYWRMDQPNGGAITSGGGGSFGGGGGYSGGGGFTTLAPRNTF